MLYFECVLLRTYISFIPYCSSMIDSRLATAQLSQTYNYVYVYVHTYADTNEERRYRYVCKYTYKLSP